MLGQQYLRVMLSRWRLVLGLVLGCTLAAWLFSALVLAQKPTFESAARLNIVPTAEELGYANRFVRGSTFDGGAVLLQTYAEFAHTQPIVAPIVDRYIAEQAARGGQSVPAWIASHSVPPAFSPGRIVAELNYGEAPRVPLRQDLIDTVIKNTKIESVEGTYLLRIGVEWDDPQSAAWFANALADAIVARAETMSRSSGAQIAGSLENRLLAKQAALADVLRRSRELKSSIGVVDVDRQKQALLEAQMAEQSRLTSDRADLQSSESQVAGLRRQADGKLSSAQGILEQTLAIEAPKASGLKQGIAVREGRVGQIGAQIAVLGKSEIAIKTLDDRATALQTEVAALTERVSFSQTENLANAPRIQLIERAIPPLVRSSPKILFNTVLGFIAGCALAGCALLLLGAAPVRTRAEEWDEAVAADEVGVPIAPGATIRPAATDARPYAPSPEPRPGPRQWSAAVRRSIGAAGALAVEAVASPNEAPCAQPEPQPLRIVPSDPVPVAAEAPAAVAQPARLFPNVLPRPVDGATYRAEEVASHGRRIAHWLADDLATDVPLLIVAASADRDARQVYQLIHDYLKQQGRHVRTLDMTRHRLKGLTRDDRKPLLYGGGLDDSGTLAALGDVEADVALVLVVDAVPGSDVIATLGSKSARIAAVADRLPYALAISG
jgi:uncharacterized protein involved in exopolysaccharide biosynthesis